MLSDERQRQIEGGGLWLNRPITDAFDEAVTQTPGKTLVVAAGGVRWTYQFVADQVSVLAQSLADMGLGHGDIISVQLPNWAEFLIIYLAATRLGAITNPLLPMYRAKELGHILEFAKSKIVFIPSTFRHFPYTDLYRELRGRLPQLQQIVVVGSNCPDDMMPFDMLLQTPPAKTMYRARPRHDGNDINLLIFTSGTESCPKGVMHSHNTMMFGNVTIAKELGLTREEVIWAASPIAHATGLQWCLRQAITLGATLVLQEIWEVEFALDLIEQERCTFTTAATPFAAMLLESSTLSGRNLTSFRAFLCGGAAIPPNLGAAMLQRMGCRLIPCWGMSECFAATICGISDPQTKQWGTDGRPIPGSETVIFDELRQTQLPPGEVGEIATRGPHVCLGYFNDKGRTTDTFSPDGWLFSNDLGFKDAEGYLRVVGRKKDIINRAGLKVSAAEIEGMLSGHPSVRAVALVGVPDPIIGEKSCAFVVPSTGGSPSLEQLVAFLKSMGTAAYKLPEYLVLVEELPMTPTGKVQKFKLREEWDSGKHSRVTDARAKPSPVAD
jgi:non-ribosomal peptide synthetase component E (peptide arylation enzyme)